MGKTAYLLVSTALTGVLLGLTPLKAAPVFPGAKGFGTDTPAGRGGRVIKVTNLNSAGPGSLRSALEAKGPRIVVFETAGVIDLGLKNLKLSEPFVTIAGQTAPAPGITIIRGGLSISTHDVLIQHIRFRPGDAGQAKKSGWEPEVTVSAAFNVVIDHCSFSWAVDENLSISKRSHDITFSNNIIAEGLADSSHREGPHSMGTLVNNNSNNIAIIGNLYAHNHSRNPSFKASTSGVIVNNVIYNPDSWAILVNWPPKGTPVVPADSRISIVGNYLAHGADTTPGVGLVAAKGGAALYLEDNIALDRNGKALPRTYGEITLLPQKSIWPKGLEAVPAERAPHDVIKFSGARPRDRDGVDLRIIKDFQERTGRIINSQAEVGGYPSPPATTRALNVPGEHVCAWLNAFSRELQQNHDE